MASAMLAGCATAPPSNYDVVNSRGFPVSREQLFETALTVSANNRMYVKASDRRSGVLNVERAIVAPSRTGAVFNWADCGAMSLLERPLSQLVELNVVVEDADRGNSKVTLNTQFTELRQGPEHATYRVNCTSTGQLEYELLQQFAKY